MKKNTLLIITMAIIGGLLVGGAVLYLHISYSSQVNALNTLNNFYLESIRGWQEKAGDLLVKQIISESEKSDLEIRLGQEVAEKKAALQKISNLEWQLKDATRESMRVEGQLTESLNRATAEVGILKANLDNEVALKKFLISQYQEAQYRETEIRLNTVKMYQSALGDYAFEKEKNKELKAELSITEGQLNTAKKLVKSVLLQATEQPIKTAGKTVKSVIIIPADVTVSIANIDILKPAIEKTCTINQLWFFAQVEETFFCEKPIVIRGKKSLKEYDGLPPVDRMIEIGREVGVSWNGAEIYAFFLWGSSDRSNWGGLNNILISDLAIKLIANNDVMGWAIVAHELGHALGLRHLATENRLALMRVNSRGWAEALDFFPFAILTDGEKIVVRRNMK